MKTSKGFRDQDHADELHKAKRLEPMHKSGKERHTLYNSLGDEEDEEELQALRGKRESAFDYLDSDEEGEV